MQVRFNNFIESNHPRRAVLIFCFINIVIDSSGCESAGGVFSSLGLLHRNQESVHKIRYLHSGHGII